MNGPAERARGKLADNIMHFGRVLRQAGLPVGPASVLDAIDAAQSGGLRMSADFYWTLHAIFVKKREHRELFDQAFHVFWQKPKMLEQLMKLMFQQIARGAGEQAKQAGYRRLADAMFDKVDAPKRQQPPGALELDAEQTASAIEQLRAKDFELMSGAEQAEARRAIALMRLAVREIRTRRFERANRGHAIDLRRTMKTSLRKGGFLEQQLRQHQKRVPPLVVLCDISGSCSNYSRMFLHFLHALANDRMRVHVFLFGTRLTNVTRELARRDVDEAVKRVSGAVKDWSGGTRIGEALHDFNRLWGRRVLTQGAEVLLMTDGLERGDLELLAHEMKRLRLSSRRIVWLNPLLRYDRFEAKAAGIRVMLPLVDEFRPVHSLDSLMDLAAALSGRKQTEHQASSWLKEKRHAG
jgi:hypothetical protein